ncbi:hypothetical protein H6775_02745 [Candidatus Nomurabacteria bacterium]|nr:hypothetical protein [Candidatus Nomurabacteria bacterium]
MNILIKKIVPEHVVPREVAELMMGCKISLVTMVNRAGIDETGGQKLLNDMLGQNDPVTHSVDVEAIMIAIEELHGEEIRDKAVEILVKTFGFMIIIATILIPADCCEMVAD